MLKLHPAVLTACAVLVLAGCSSGEDVDATHLTIVTTETSLDQATALAVAEYVAEHDIDVELEQYGEPDEVFAALDPESETPMDHARIGVLTAHQDPTIDEEPQLRVPDSVEVLTQAPAELSLVAAASTVTAAEFVQHQDEDADQGLQTACEDQTWLHTQTPEHELETIMTALTERGCVPEFEAVRPSDRAGYAALAHRVTVEHDTVALLYGIDPVIPDEGLTTLDVVTDQWPPSNVVAVAAPDLEDPLTEHIGAVLEVLDNGAATDLLRGYHNAQTSTSDLDYEATHAIRHWLATHGLVDQDTVIEISADTT